MKKKITDSSVKCFCFVLEYGQGFGGRRGCEVPHDPIKRHLHAPHRRKVGQKI